jgi:hypothetical protein
LGERFPKSLSVHFGRREFDRARKKFDDWYTLVHGDLPVERSRVVKLSAEREFELFEQRIFHKMIDGWQAVEKTPSTSR